MVRKKGLGRAAALVVLLALVGPVAAANAAGTGAGQGTEGGWLSLDGLWSWIKVLLPPVAETTSCEKGSSIDPNGGCVAAARMGGSDRGTSIGPNR